MPTTDAAEAPTPTSSRPSESPPSAARRADQRGDAGGGLPVGGYAFRLRTGGHDQDPVPAGPAGHAGSAEHATPAEPAASDSAEETAGPRSLRVTIDLAGRDASLSEILPVLHSVGFDVFEEYPSRSVRPDGTVCRTYDLTVTLTPPTPPTPSGAAFDEFAAAVEATLGAIWSGTVDADPFNSLVVRAGLSWRQADVLRAYGRYLRQLTFPFSLAYVGGVLAANPDITGDLVALFAGRLDPAAPDSSAHDPAARVPATEALEGRLLAAIDQLAGIDADRILRAYLALIRATVRTNYFRGDPELGPQVLVLKLAPSEVDDVPLPRPVLETYVHSRRVEGVHLRFGAVARGGLRYSDRPQDFRTEILGLAKAQTTKNAVIVPWGAKGGFVVKQPPVPAGDDPAADRAAAQDEAVACYRLFVGGLLDVVDDLDVETGTVLTDPAVRRHDPDDTYLVVAADKGTATFSDHANAVALERGYWLGDAFASGGSVGYDHKRMGITARGAWESVRQHLGELGHDVDRDETTVVGIGDMSGDVFGNGLLLSRGLKLVAAFDHRHVFLDPDPDPVTSFAERERLFGLDRSSWQDYDPTLISDGGGVWARSAKSIPLSAPVRQVLDIAAATATPDELVAAILRAPVDLLWNGGIGTYVKAAAETNAAVADKANDAVRVDADQVRARVVGEGGNLGLTPRARIEYARAGGRIHTDSVDNSAGVDCSDHEVNIKIVVDAALRNGRVEPARRAALLEEMTDEVARLVLADNRDQNELLGVSRASADRDLPLHARLLETLEEHGALDRAIDVLPTPAAIRGLETSGAGLSSPELATLMALAKLTLKQEILADELPDAAVLSPLLLGYFPRALQQQCRAEILAHPLRRQIVATLLANDVVNTGGLTYLLRLQENTSADVGSILRAHVIASAVFDLPALRATLRRADLTTSARIELDIEMARLLDRATRWVLVHRPQPTDVAAEIERYRSTIAELGPDVTGWLAGHDARTVTDRTARLDALGVPPALARRLGALVYEFSLLNVVDAAELAGTRDAGARDSGTRDPGTHDTRTTAEVYFALSAHLDVGHILTELSATPPSDRWDARARLQLRDDLRNALCSLVSQVLTTTPDERDPVARVEQWTRASQRDIDRLRTVQQRAQAEFGDTKSTSVLAVMTRHIQDLDSSASPH